MKIGIIGAGRVGKCLAYLLKEDFEIIGLSSSEQELSEFLNFKIFSKEKNIFIVENSEIVFITTPDDLIEKTCNEIFSNNKISKKFVFHCSGCHSSEILKKAKNNKCFIGSIHPLQSVPNFEQGIKNLKNAYFCIEGDVEAQEIAKKIVNSISGKYFTINSEFKPLYHLGAVFSSNFINTLIFITCEIYKKIGISDNYEKIVEIIKPLFNGTINSINNSGVIKSLTGPVVRGDIITIEKHLDSIKKFYPEILEIYKNLCKENVKLAEKVTFNEKIKTIEEMVR